MSNIIEVNFPKKSNYKKTRSRVFFLSYYYTGLTLCQDIGSANLKRKPNNIWGLQSYFQGRVVELDECHADDMEAMLSWWLFVEDIELEQLRNYGWRHSGDVVHLGEFFEGQGNEKINNDTIRHSICSPSERGST